MDHRGYGLVACFYFRVGARDYAALVESSRQIAASAIWKIGRCRALLLAASYFVALTRGLAAAAFHQFVEGFEIGACLACGEEFRCLEGGKLFCDGCGDELVDAGAIFLALQLDRLFQRDWKAQGIGFCFCHGRILLLASAVRRLYSGAAICRSP